MCTTVRGVQDVFQNEKQFFFLFVFGGILNDLGTALWCSAFCFRFTDECCFFQPESWQGIGNSDFIYPTRAHSSWCLHQPVWRRLLFNCYQQSLGLIFISANSVNILNTASAWIMLYSSYRVPDFGIEIGTEAGPQWLKLSSVMCFITGVCDMCCKAVYNLNLTT